MQNSSCRFVCWLLKAFQVVTKSFRDDKVCFEKASNWDYPKTKTQFQVAAIQSNQQSGISTRQSSYNYSSWFQSQRYFSCRCEQFLILLRNFPAVSTFKVVFFFATENVKNIYLLLFWFNLFNFSSFLHFLGIVSKYFYGRHRMTTNF